MGVPNVFKPGDIAASSQVNANFDFITSILGDDSVAGELHPADAVVVGEGTQVSLSNHAGVGVLSWNAAEYLDGSNNRKYSRQVTGKPATVLELDENGFSVKTTSATQGDLNSQLQKIFGVHATTGSDWIYIPYQFHIQRIEREPVSVEDYRLTYIGLAEPKTIFDGVSFDGAGVTVYNAYDYVPTYAQAIQVVMHITAWEWSGSALMVYPDQKTRHWKYGTLAHAYGGDVLGRSAGEGIVPLGRDAYRGKFVVERTAGFETASLFIKGYWV